MMSMTSRMLLSSTRTMMKPSRFFCISNVMSKNVAPGTVWADKNKVPYLYGLTPEDPDDPVRKYVSNPAFETFGKVMFYLTTTGVVATGLIIYWEVTETYVDDLKRHHGVLPPKK